jgi:hypothetical protein
MKAHHVPLKSREPTIQRHGVICQKSGVLDHTAVQTPRVAGAASFCTIHPYIITAITLREPFSEHEEDEIQNEFWSEKIKERENLQSWGQIRG